MKKIFIIEDDEILRENLITLLQEENFETYSTETGKEGIEQIRNIKPDCILCDIMLPDMDGYQIVAKIKSDEKTKYIPFLFLTARAEMKDLRTGMNLGADDYLTKPYDSLELIKVIKKRIELSRNDDVDSQNLKAEKQAKISINDYIFVQSSKHVKKIAVKNILCIIASAEYTDIFTEDGGRVLVRKLMKTWEQILPGNNFIRIHKSIIINMQYLQKVEKWFNNSFKIYLQKYPEPLISSRRYSANLRSLLLK